MSRSYEELRIRPGTLELAAKSWGPPNAPVLLALHGWLDNAASFDALAPLLAGFRVVALDLPGHGHSAHRPTGCHYHFVDYLADVVGCVDALGLERFGLLGHSMGAGIGSLLAGTFPERVSALVLIEGLGPQASAAPGAPERLRRAIDERTSLWPASQKHYASREEMVDRLRRVVPALPLASATALVERNSQPTPQGYRWRYDPRLRGTSPLRLTEELVEAFLRAITAPTLLIQGRQGMFVGNSGVQRRCSWVMDLRQETIAGGHHVHLENPQDVASAIAAFLNQIF